MRSDLTPRAISAATTCSSSRLEAEPGFRLKAGLRTRGQLEQPFGVAAVDLFADLGRQVEAVDGPDRLADVQARLWVERHVGGEQDAVGAEELQAAAGAGR